MGVLSVIKAQFSKKIKFKKNDAESEPNASARVAANLLTRFSSSCRCGGISIPAERVGKIYRCIQCNAIRKLLIAVIIYNVVAL